MTTTLPDGAAVTDPDAPFGRREDGTPYKRPPEWRAAAGAAMAAGRAKAASTPKRGPGRPRKTPAPTAQPPGYETAVAGLLQLPAFALMIGSRWLPALALDSMALTVHTPAIAQAAASVAAEDARVAAAIERMANVGPYGALIIATLPLMLQLGANHGAIPTNREAGILTPDELMSAAGIEPQTEAAPSDNHRPPDVPAG